MWDYWVRACRLVRRRDGLLAIATDLGLKVVDFRTDKLLTIAASGTTELIGTISQRRNPRGYNGALEAPIGIYFFGNKYDV